MLFKSGTIVRFRGNDRIQLFALKNSYVWGPIEMANAALLKDKHRHGA